jgi:two-component system, chemotaxis family, chemotaxis protein CheY
MSGLTAIDKKIPVLIVDDFSTMRRIVKNCLKQLGFDNITEADDGQTAWTKLQTGEVEFKLIISDWNMPNMMGIDLLRAVRADDKYKTVPFLMVTAEGQKDNILEAAKAGVTNYVIKPFTADILQQKLEAIFKKG